MQCEILTFRENPNRNHRFIKHFNKSVKSTLLEVSVELETIINKLGLKNKIAIDKIDIAELSNSVNVERLMNNPIRFNNQDITAIYEELIEELSDS